MKKIISGFVAGAMLFSAFGLTTASAAAPPVLKDDSVLLISKDGSSVCGTDGAVTAAFLAGEFDGEVTVTDPFGMTIAGESLVPAGSTVSTDGGEISVMVHGDANADGNVNLSDATVMLMSIAGWDVTINEEAADPTLDGSADLTDVTRMLKHFAGWDVKLGYKKVIFNDDAQIAFSEDETTYLWTDHGTTKQERSDTTSTESCTYLINAAKNEAEGATVYIAPATDKNNITVSVTDFENSYGDTVKADAYTFHYHNMKEFGLIPDAIMPSESTYKASVASGQSQGFYINATTTEETESGLYEATVSIREDGVEIKRAKLYLNVWDFTLDDADAPRSAFGLDKASTAGNHNISINDPERYNDMYRIYYDFLLEHRVNAFILPYDVESDEADSYINDPRVNSFAVHGANYGGIMNASLEQIQARYEKLKDDPDLFAKAYFYCADEPYDEKDAHERANGSPGVYQEMRNAKALIDEYFPGGKQVVPFVSGQGISFFDGFLDLYTETTDILCGKTYAFVSEKYYGTDIGNGGEGVWRVQPSILGDYGTYKNYVDTVLAENENKENWWYFAELPAAPLTTYHASPDGMYVRMSGFQMYQQDVTGVLYYAVTDYHLGNGNSVLNGYGLEFTTPEGDPAWGNGILVYSGMRYGIDGPIGSVRLEYIRDSFEDYMYVRMAERVLGKDATDGLVLKVTRDMVDFEKDAAVMQTVRAEIAEAIVSAQS